MRNTHNLSITGLCTLHRRFRCVGDEHRWREEKLEACPGSLEIIVRDRDRNAETHADCQSQCVSTGGEGSDVSALLSP